MANSPQLGGLERGSRGRIDFTPLDRKVAEESANLLRGATNAADNLPALAKIPSDIMVEGKKVLDKFPLEQGTRESISKSLIKLRNSNEVVGDTTGRLAKELDSAIRAMDNPKATLGVVPQLYWSLGQDAGNSTAIQQARSVLKEAADAGSGGKFSILNKNYGVAVDKLKGAEASDVLRKSVMGQGGIPTTGNFYGSVDAGDAIPQMTSQGVRRGMGAATKSGGIEQIDPQKVKELGLLADQLRGHEIYKPGSSGGSALDLGGAEGTASSILNAGPLWRLRGALGSVFGGLNKASQNAVDQALLDPNAFMKMVDAKRALKRPLEAWEKVAVEAIRGTSRSQAISTGD
jgi:hypothetical protein